jgi:hypothetical protein
MIDAKKVEREKIRFERLKKKKKSPTERFIFPSQLTPQPRKPQNSQTQTDLTFSIILSLYYRKRGLQGEQFKWLRFP